MIAHPECVSSVPLAWQIAGPYEPTSAADVSLSNDATQAGPWPPEITGDWILYQPELREGGIVDFNRAFGYHENAVAYALTTLHVEHETPAELVCGSDDGLTLWLNGERLIDARQPRALAYDAHRIRVSLHAGENRVLARVTQGIGDWKLSATFWDVSALPHRVLQSKPNHEQPAATQTNKPHLGDS